MRKILFTVVTVVVLLGLVTGCAPAEAEELQISLIAPLSGPAAPWGIPMMRGAECYAERVNEAGGLKVGKKTYELKVLGYDNKYDPTETVSATRKAIDDGAVMVIGVGGGNIPAIQTLAEPAGVIDMAIAAGSYLITNPQNPLTFQTIFSTQQLTEETTDAYLPFFKAKRVAILQPDDDLGRDHGSYFKEYLAKAYPEVEVVAEEYFPRGTVDFYPVLGRIIAKKSDYIFTVNCPQGTLALIAKQSRELGYSGPIVGGTDVIPSKMIEMAGAENLDLVLCRYYVKPPTPLYQELNELQMDKYGEVSDSFQVGYGSIDVWARAVEKAGTLEPMVVAETMANSEYPDFVKGPAKWVDWGCGIKRCLKYRLELAIFEGGEIHDWYEWEAMNK